MWRFPLDRHNTGYKFVSNLLVRGERDLFGCVVCAHHNS